MTHDPTQQQGPDGPAEAARTTLSQVIATLSYALDLTEGQPVGHAARCCLLGMRMAEELRLSADDRSALYYALLMKDAGCSANAAETARIFGSNDMSVKANLKTVDWTRKIPAALYAWRNSSLDGPFLAKLRHFIGIARGGREEGPTRLVRIRCERGADIAQKMGFPVGTSRAVLCLDEHWDGGGNPEGRAGDEIPLFSRIALLAQTLDVFVMEGGHAEALEMARSRSGTWFDPALVDIATGWADDAAWWRTVYGADVDTALAEAEPSERVVVADEAWLDRVAEGFADIIDAKSPYTARHSAGVAGYATLIAQHMGEGPEVRRDLRRAGLLHDIGKLAITNRILDKNGPLTAGERKAIEMHPVHTWTILSQVDALAPIARTASLHHERLDGKGYPWGVNPDELTRDARILATADVFEALTADRPYRAGMDIERTFSILDEDASALDGDAVDALREVVKDHGGEAWVRSGRVAAAQTASEGVVRPAEGRTDSA